MIHRLRVTGPDVLFLLAAVRPHEGEESLIQGCASPFSSVSKTGMSSEKLLTCRYSLFQFRQDKLTDESVCRAQVCVAAFEDARSVQLPEHNGRPEATRDVQWSHFSLPSQTCQCAGREAASWWWFEKRLAIATTAAGSRVPPVSFDLHCRKRHDSRRALNSVAVDHGLGPKTGLCGHKGPPDVTVEHEADWIY